MVTVLAWAFPPKILQGLTTFYQCVKRELPYEAVHLYQKLKTAQEGGFDLAMCNSLLNVAVGKGPGPVAPCCSWCWSCTVLVGSLCCNVLNVNAGSDPA